jgi:hypothetical protein
MTGETFLSSYLARIELWHNAVMAWLDRPFLGHGIGSFEQAFAPHRGDHAWFLDRTILDVPWYAAGAAHNAILQILIETGLIGLILCGVFLWTVGRCGISAVLIAALTMCLIEFPEQNPASAIFISCALGLASRVKPSEPFWH